MLPLCILFCKEKLTFVLGKVVFEVKSLEKNEVKEDKDKKEEDWGGENERSKGCFGGGLSVHFLWYSKKRSKALTKSKKHHLALSFQYPLNYIL